MNKKNKKNDNSASFVGHLTELRSRLVKSFIFLIFLFIICYIFSTSSIGVSSDRPFLKLFIPLATSPIKEDIFPRPKRRTTKTTTIAICQNPGTICLLYTKIYDK